VRRLESQRRGAQDRPTERRVGQPVRIQPLRDHRADGASHAGPHDKEWQLLQFRQIVALDLAQVVAECDDLRGAGIHDRIDDLNDVGDQIFMTQHQASLALAIPMSLHVNSNHHDAVTIHAARHLKHLGAIHVAAITGYVDDQRFRIWQCVTLHSEVKLVAIRVDNLIPSLGLVEARCVHDVLRQFLVPTKSLTPLCEVSDLWFPRPLLCDIPNFDYARVDSTY
jgi:hypothetical protein